MTQYLGSGGVDRFNGGVLAEYRALDRHSSNYMEHLEGLKKMACVYVTANKEKYPNAYEEFCSDKSSNKSGSSIKT